MREIKFRGKVNEHHWLADTNEWIYGFYKEENQKTFIGASFGKRTFTFIEVDAQSVGQMINFKDSMLNELYEGDILSLEAKDIRESDLFWNSNIGKEMKDKSLEEVLIVLGFSDVLGITFTGYFKKENKFVTDNEYYGIEDEKDSLHSFKDDGMLFIRYLINKGAKIIGNQLDNPEMLPNQNNY